MLNNTTSAASFAATHTGLRKQQLLDEDNAIPNLLFSRGETGCYLIIIANASPITQGWWDSGLK